MSYDTVPDPERLTVEDYLEREALSETKHEYVAGWLYAFAGASRTHNRIATHLIRWMADAAEGGPLKALGSDMLLRAAADLFYYPDITVGIDPSDTDERYVSRPCLIVEILSPTADKDLREKLVVYRNIATLQGYLIVAPDDGWIELRRRGADGAWEHERAHATEAITFPCLPFKINVATVFEGIPSR